jgi:5-aminolevulinate synthase
MDKFASITKFKASCPYLSRTKSQTLRTLCTKASPRYPSLSKLTVKATGCPVMGPALHHRSGQIVANYASVAGNAEVQKIHEQKGVTADVSSADIQKCPHASKAIAAARVAEELARVKSKLDGVRAAKPSTSTAAVAAGCPFHAAANRTASTESAKKAPVPGGFDYEKFYDEQLEAKHKDASYRYFTNINRKAEKFPVAHTGNPKNEVEVWCANDYLGMGNNPVVLETMQYVWHCAVIVSESMQSTDVSFFHRL